MPVQLPAHRCYRGKLGCERQDLGNMVQDPLQLISERLADSIEESVTAVNARCYEGMDESLHRLLAGRAHCETDQCCTGGRTHQDRCC